MKVVGVIGMSALGKSTLVDELIGALRLAGWSVSTVKRAPDGFDLDRPGKASHARRQAGAREVMLVGDRRLALMQEFASGAEPSLESLLARLVPVDVVIAEGFKGAAIPTVEVCGNDRSREGRWKSNPDVIALVSDAHVDAPLPQFKVDEAPRLAAHIASVLALARGA